MFFTSYTTIKVSERCIFLEELFLLMNLPKFERAIGCPILILGNILGPKPPAVPQVPSALTIFSSIKFVVIFIAQSDHAMVGTFVSHSFYTAKKERAEFTTVYQVIVLVVCDFKLYLPWNRYKIRLQQTHCRQGPSTNDIINLVS